MTPVWILAARKLAVPIICTAAASVVYDRFSLPAEVPAEGPAGNTSQRKILRENVRGLCSVIVPGIECNCPALHSMPGQHAGYSDTSNNCIINLCSIRDVIVFFFFFCITYSLSQSMVHGCRGKASPLAVTAMSMVLQGRCKWQRRTMALDSYDTSQHVAFFLGCSHMQVSLGPNAAPRVVLQATSFPATGTQMALHESRRGSPGKPMDCL